MADSGWGCKSNGANPRWGCKSNFDGAVSPMGRCVHTNWGAQYRGAVSPASLSPMRVTGGVSFGGEPSVPFICPFYLVSMPGEVKYPTNAHNIQCYIL